MSDESVQELWDAKYRSGHRERYPWDAVVSFLFRHAPRDRARDAVRVLEVGFGTGNNLWCAAREGFAVAGVEFSEAAVIVARARFVDEQLAGDLQHGSFTALPFSDGYADLAIDRAAITCASRDDAVLAVSELHRVLQPGGRVLSCLYATQSTSASSGTRGTDGRRHDITSGTLTNVGPLRFYDETEVRDLFAAWRVISLARHDRTEYAGEPIVHAEWHVIAEKPL
ncbi:MAG: class I SAM-dependent methyltransferase [Gemmatimonadaceae bacterium]|nr:class I SAM-dependent methyltransferase [Gemmatimonadaceae bacterium]